MDFCKYERNKPMKKLIALLLAAAFLCAASCMAESFELMGITFATAPEEAEVLLGGDVEKHEESYPQAGSITLLRKYDVELFGYNAAAITLSYYNDKLMGVTINYTDDALSDAAALAENVSARYGEGVILDEYFYYEGEYYYSADDIFGETRRYAEWDCFEEGIEAAITLDLVEDSEYFCFLAFMNQAVTDEMYAAVLPLLDE